MNTEQLANLLLAPEEEFQTHRRIVETLASLREQARRKVPTPPVTPRLAEAEPPPPGRARRPAMRPPAEGSVRADVYRILEGEGKPMSPSEVAAAAAVLRGEPITDNLRAAVQEALRNPHDDRIRKLAKGQYQIVPQ